MKKEWYLSKYISLHNTMRYRECFEFDLLPAIIISDWRIMIGWLCFRLQISFKAMEEDVWE